MYARSLKESPPLAGRCAVADAHDSGLGLPRALAGSDTDLDAMAATRLPFAANMTDDEAALAQAHRILKLMRASRDFFPVMRDLGDHPGWELLLHIFIAGRHGATVTTADLCEQTGTWRPLAIRYIELLFERGLIDRDISGEKPDAWALSLTPATGGRLTELLCSFAAGLREPDGDGAAN